MHPAPDTSKHSHLAEEEMQMTTLGIEPQFGGTSTVEGILHFSIIIIAPLLTLLK